MSTHISSLPRGLYAITPDGLPTPDLVRRVGAALAGGARTVQYRNKSADPSTALEQARALLALTRATGAAFIVNDSVELALAVDADGVHLGATDGDLRAARAAIGGARLLGASCYDRLDTAREALAAGADHVAFGAAYVSSTKPGALRASLDLYRSARAALDCPIVAIGGITAANAAPLVEAGVDALAVITALFESAEPAAIEAAARSIARLYP